MSVSQARTCALVFVSMSIVSSPSRPAIAQDNPSSIQEALLDKTFQIDGELHNVKIVMKEFESRSVFLDGREQRSEMTVLEMFIKRTSDEKNDTRRIWMSYGPSMLQNGIVTGHAILDVAVWENRSPTTLLLAIANSHHAGYSLIKIDPDLTVPELAREHIEVEKSRWEPERPKELLQNRVHDI